MATLRRPSRPGGCADDLRYGWRYIRTSSGLPSLLATFSLLSFFVNIAVVAATPLVLSFTNAAEFGVVAAAGGAGIVAGGLVMVTWRAARRVPMMLAALCGTGIFIALYGVRPSALLVAVGQFGFFFCLPIANAPAAGIWQRRVPGRRAGPGVLGPPHAGPGHRAHRPPDRRPAH